MEGLLKFLYHIAPALVTVTLGGFILQRFFVSRANQSSLIDSLIKDFDSLRADALEYWNVAGTTKVKKERAQLLTQKIKGLIRSINSDLSYFGRRYCKKIDFASLLVEVSDACTGGAFETANKVPDPGRYILVINTINRVKSELLRQKL